MNLADRLRDAAELLESIASDRSLLAGLPEEDRTRLLQAAGRVSRPDAIDRCFSYETQSFANHLTSVAQRRR